MRFITLLFLIISFVYAKTAYEKGKELYIQKVCYSCHGNKAEGIDNYPKLSNRAKSYLSYKLKRFRDKLSDNQQQEMMILYSTGLSDKNINNLTTFLSEYKDER